MIGQLLNVSTMLTFRLQTICHQHSVFPQLIIELFILSFPPFFVRLSHNLTLVLSVATQQFLLLSSEIVEHSFIGGNF